MENGRVISDSPASKSRTIAGTAVAVVKTWIVGFDASVAHTVGEPAQLTLQRPTTPVHLLLPFKGDSISILVKRRLGAALRRTYNAVRLAFVEETTSVPTTRRKDSVLMLAS